MVLPVEWSGHHALAVYNLGIVGPKIICSSMAEVPAAMVEITPTFALSFNGAKPVAIPPHFIVQD